jgi:serine protease AprX
MVTGTRVERSNALWGRSGRLRAIAAGGVLCIVLAMPGVASASPPKAQDRTPPDTTIVAGPAPGSTAFGAVSLSFAASEQASFQCSLDGKRFQPCPATTTLAAVPVGPHDLSVRAVDLAGNVDATPATTSWTEGYASTTSYAAGSLLAAASVTPLASFPVIVMTQSSRDIRLVQNALSLTSSHAHVASSFTAICGFPATLPGWEILWLSEKWPAVTAVVRDKRVRDPLPPETFNPAQVWQQAIGADRLWATASKAPTIAVIDSGIDSSKVADFGGRVIARVNLGAPSTQLDDYGHGTFVASIAAGAASSYPGVAPDADLVDVRVIGADGSGATSDVIAGIDWVLKHKDAYDIKVVNLSLESSKAGSFRFDPLDQAVESLWLNGITVVTSSGNSGTGTPQKMDFAPANDPFVITVGAADVNGTIDPADDSVAPWSSFGYTADGFSEPTLVAPGRRMIGAVPAGSTLAVSLPDRSVAPGYMLLSGTSLAAGAVSGAAAQLLALHPNWSPDQVKGALMLTARPVSAADGQAGVGEIDLAAAAVLRTPPNPDVALERFVVSDPTAPGGRAFDSASWVEAAKADPSWFTSSFAGASWSDVSWAGASWGEASWVESAFASASWVDAAQADAVLTDASWGD